MKNLIFFLLSASLFPSSSFAGANQDLYATNAIYDAVLKAAEFTYGVQCNRENVKEQITSQGYYNDLTINVTVPCGAPTKNGKFSSLSIRFHFLQTELEGDVHVGCIEPLFVEPEFGHRDPVVQCGH